MTHCTDGSWCCGAANTTCCNDNLGFQIPSVIAPYITTVSTSTGTGSSTAAVSSAQNSQPTTLSQNATSSSSNKGAEIGLGAALGVIVIAVVVAGIYLWRNKRSSRTGLIELGTNSPGQSVDSNTRHPMVAVQHFPNQQVPQQQYGHEMQTLQQTPGNKPNGMYAAELDGAAGTRSHK